jgi:hypothetical protein
LILFFLLSSLRISLRSTLLTHLLRVPLIQIIFSSLHPPVSLSRQQR